MASKIKFIIAIGGLFLILLSACDNSSLYSSTQKIDSVWTQENKLTFEFDVLDTLQANNMYLELEHFDSYPFQNIYLLVETIYPEGNKIQSQLNIDLANKAGKWHGKCNGAQCTLEVVMSENFYFKNLGKHQFNLIQNTRSENLKGIKSLTLKIEKQ